MDCIGTDAVTAEDAKTKGRIYEKKCVLSARFSKFQNKKKTKIQSKMKRCKRTYEPLFVYT